MRPCTIDPAGACDWPGQVRARGVRLRAEAHRVGGLRRRSVLFQLLAANQGDERLRPMHRQGARGPARPGRLREVQRLMRRVGVRVVVGREDALGRPTRTSGQLRCERVRSRGATARGRVRVAARRPRGGDLRASPLSLVRRAHADGGDFLRSVQWQLQPVLGGALHLRGDARRGDRAILLDARAEARPLRQRPRLQPGVR